MNNLGTTLLVHNTESPSSTPPGSPRRSPSSIDQLVNNAAQPIMRRKGNADFDLTATKTAVYLTVDIVGGSRQVCAATEAGATLAGSALAAAGAATAVALGLLFTGVLSAGTAVAWSLPKAYQDLKEAKVELANVTEKPAIEEAQQAVQSAKLGVANHCLYFTMGLAQITVGIIAMLCEGAAHLLHYAAVLKGAAAAIATAIAGIILGAVYAIRGAVMGIRAYMNYSRAKAFHEEFAKSFNNDNPIKNAALFMMTAEIKRGENYLSRRMDLSVLDGIEAKTANYTEQAQQLEYLKQVDKGIYTEELDQKVAMGIAAAMFIGGVLAIVLSVLSGGIAIPIIAAVSAAFFIGMEYTFVVYDSSDAFENFRDRSYVKPEYIRVLEQQLALEALRVLEQQLGIEAQHQYVGAAPAIV